ncbi:MAG: aspartate aminotransferase family protein [Deltaproteobacteria bacterium]|nr:MAG: aspartate aminotransferase family protein [Deltaproteobacteria bacterium]
MTEPDAPLFRTWQAQRGARTMVIDRAENARIHVPGEGWKWDMASQSYNVNVGHGRREVIEAMGRALDAAVLTAGPNVDLPERNILAERLRSMAGMDRVFFALSGAEAVENALKIAMLVTGRRKVVARRHSYHGATLSTLAVAGDPRREPFWEGVAGTWIDDPYPPRMPDGGRPSDWVESLEAALAAEGPERVAAVVLEGLTGTNGVQIPPPDFWPKARELADRHGFLLVADEVFSGLGRTGRTFGFEHFGGAPDLIVLGKGLTSGYAPLSAVLVSAPVARHFDDEVLWCGLTHYASPIGCAAALACLDLIEGDGLVGRAKTLGKALIDVLADLAKHDDRIADVRGRGLQIGIELACPAESVSRALWNEGYFVPAKRHMLYVCPPLTVEAAALEAFPEVLARALAGASAEGST